ncbi:MAG: peptidoglycan editing factor PgeF [Candidatus Aminicenantes bacterium]|nr:MAG: peptidoglycan editing factor PgeF [Candidatus Aminicenantes bacterium]
MTETKQNNFITIPQLENISFLIQGFGTERWKEEDFKRRPEWKNFRLLFLDQIHSDVIQSIDEIPRGNLKGDAMVTSLSSLFLIIRTADCLPALIVSQSPKVIAAVHCGRRGTCKRVVQRAIHRMIDHYGCDPSVLLVALGPLIGSRCYEVGEDVLMSFEKDGHSTESFQNHPTHEGKYLFDLKEANISQMLNLGIKKDNIFSVDICTHCHRDFASYRRDKDKASRVLSFIGMKG